MKWLLIWVVVTGTGTMQVSLPEQMTFPTAEACNAAAEAFKKLDSLGTSAKATCIEVQLDAQEQE